MLSPAVPSATRSSISRCSSRRCSWITTFASASRTLLLACAVLGLAACGGGKPAFHSTDITGVDYGRDFNLTDHNGKARRVEDFRGKTTVVFFGYTQCPDVCPTTLSTMAQVMKLLGDDAAKVQVLFITLDPERDTQPLLAEYVPQFDKRFLGLRGDAASTERVAKDFKVFYQRQPGTTPGSYTIDHSAATYVYDPQGRLRLYVRHGETPERIAQDLRALLSGA